MARKKLSKKQNLWLLGETLLGARKGETMIKKAKDGSIATHSTVPVPDVLESVVLKECLGWLRSRWIVADRNNTGFGDVGNTGMRFRYGIKGAGDIIAILQDGKHLEIECKRGRGGRLSMDQQERMKKVQDNNGVYLVVHGVVELEVLIVDFL